MPQVFSPGEGETRPLDPTSVVYTTAQKVADLLDIGPQEAITTSYDSDVDGIYVTGAEYRNIGFSVGDTILVYSDADPMGFEKEIGEPTTSINGVKLPFVSGTVTASDYQTADNTYIQNQASFSNGRTRGITKSKVESIILRMQDHIDNRTHNAWRPYLVQAEYINFDTYKPYRRRYYTDYVGTAPLLFRNVQQILRLELWQGDDYREIAAAEVRLQIPETVQGVTGSIVLSPGNGTAATLTIGTGTNQWRSAFDKTTTAQNLADLINKEDRVSKTSVEFSPAFKLEGDAVNNVGVHNEFLASANSDYGTGTLKITSMRDTKGGETCSIVSTIPGVGISQTGSSSTTFSSLNGTTITVTSTGTTDGSVTSFSTIVGGSGYTAANGVTTSGGTGSGLTVNTTVNSGSVESIVIASPGADYANGDVITINGGTATFTVSAVSSNGFVDAGVVIDSSGDVFSYTGKTATTFTGCTAVLGSLSAITGTLTQHKLIIDLHGGSSSGDKGRLRDWWMDSEMGIIYFNNSYPFFEWNAIKTSYIYGERYVDKAIEDICTKMVAIDLLLSDDRSVLIPEGTQNVDLSSKIQLYKMDIEKTFPRYIEVVAFE